MQIAIIDYGLGNLYSVLGAIRKVGYNAIITNDISKIELADKLILPGVGAFGDGMRNIQKLGLIDPLNFLVNFKKIPILAICLGFQILSQKSSEFGTHKGLGWIDSTVDKLITKNKDLRVPHVGWNNLKMQKNSVLWDGIPDDALFYYVHSFHMQCRDKNIIIGNCTYGNEFVAAIQKNNIFATQFHPEKSQLHGLRLIRNFIEKV